MLHLWWDWKGVLYYELLPQNQTINSNKYSSQTDQLKTALNEKCLELVKRKLKIFHQANARPHVSLMTRQKLLQLGWEVLIPLLYSPLDFAPLDIAPLDFHWFQYLQNSLNGNFQFSGRRQKVPGTVLCLKRYKVLRRWKYEVAWKMAEGSRTKWWTCCSIKLLVKMENVSFSFT